MCFLCLRSAPQSVEEYRMQKMMLGEEICADGLEKLWNCTWALPILKDIHNRLQDKYNREKEFRMNITYRLINQYNKRKRTAESNKQQANKKPKI